MVIKPVSPAVRLLMIGLVASVIAVVSWGLVTTSRQQPGGSPRTAGDPNASKPSVDESDAAQRPKIAGESGFAGARALNIELAGSDQVRISLPENPRDAGGYYVLFKLTGVRGRTVTLDFDGPLFGRWKGATPVYGYAENLDEPKWFASEEHMSDQTRVDQSGSEHEPRGHWHFFSTVEHHPDRLRARAFFLQDQVYVTLRVPYTPKLAEAFADGLKSSAHVRVHEAGRTPEGRPLHIFEISQARMTKPATTTRPSSRPCVLIYAREHADEQDSSWVAQGALDLLASDSPEAQAARERCDFLIIPVLDPDGAAVAAHERIMQTFRPIRSTPEATAYATWFKRWIDDGGRIDVAVALHNPPPGSAFHMACPMMEGGERRTYGLAVHKLLRESLLAAGYKVRNTPWTYGVSPSRLSGWLGAVYGTLTLPYEMNSQTPADPLELPRLRELGARLAFALAHALTADEGIALRTEVTSTLEARHAAWENNKEQVVSDDPFRAEIALRSFMQLSHGN